MNPIPHNPILLPSPTSLVEILSNPISLDNLPLLAEALARVEAIVMRGHHPPDRDRDAGARISQRQHQRHRCQTEPPPILPQVPDQKAIDTLLKHTPQLAGGELPSPRKLAHGH